MSGPLAGRTALVTGGSRGLGFAAVEALCAAGARVALLARDERRLAEAAARLGPAALPIVADVAAPGSVREAFATARAAFGRLDALVNNAAIGRLHRLEDASDESLRAQVETNLLGVLHCCREAIPWLRAGGGGDIVNISSDSVRDPFPYLLVYAATKGGVEVFTHGLRRELRPDGIRVTLLRSGPALTSFGEDWEPELAELASRAWQEGGYLGADGVLDPRIVGESLVHALSRPAGAGVEVLELRPSSGGPGEKEP